MRAAASDGVQSGSAIHSSTLNTVCLYVICHVESTIHNIQRIKDNTTLQSQSQCIVFLRSTVCAVPGFGKTYKAATADWPLATGVMS